jgi:dihydroxy-acid dehydratase
VDAEQMRLHVELSDEEIAARRAVWVKPEPTVLSGALAKYARLVGPASKGAVTS